MLKDDAAIGTRRADRLALDEDLAGFRGEKAADEIEQRRLAAAGGSEQRDEFTPAHVERYVLEREHRPPARWAIAMAHACDGDLRLRHGPQPCPPPSTVRQASEIATARQSPQKGDRGRRFVNDAARRRHRRPRARLWAVHLRRRQRPREASRPGETCRDRR